MADKVFKVLSDVKAPPRKRFTPIGNNVAIHIYQVDQTAAGLVLPNGTGNDYETPRALVVAVGPDVKQIKEGDMIFAGNEVRIIKVRFEGDEYFLIPEDKVAGILLPKVVGG